MRLLPSGDGVDDSGISHMPSHYDPDYDHTPYVLPYTSQLSLMQPCPSSHSSGFPRDGATCTAKSDSFIDGTERLGASSNCPSMGIATRTEPTPSFLAVCQSPTL